MKQIYSVLKIMWIFYEFNEKQLPRKNDLYSISDDKHNHRIEF